MKTFDEVNVGDDLYVVYTNPYIEIKKEKIIDIKHQCDYLIFTVGDKWANSEFGVEHNETVGFWAPSIEGAIEYREREYQCKINSAKKEIEQLEIKINKFHDKLDKILKVKEQYEKV